MEMTKATEQKQDSGRKYTNLDNRYGKIRVSAVPAPVCHPGGQRHTTEAHLEPYDRDCPVARPGRQLAGRLFRHPATTLGARPPERPRRRSIYILRKSARSGHER